MLLILIEELERFVKLQGHELEKLKLKYEEEIHNLKQENYVLSAKVSVSARNSLECLIC